jgi:hypothetical protein
LRGWEREGAEWVVREGWGQGGEMTQALYVHINNKRKKKERLCVKKKVSVLQVLLFLDHP